MHLKQASLLSKEWGAPQFIVRRRSLMEYNFSVSVIVPCRNEIKFIEKCLDSIIAQDYPKEKLEILVVDGFSEDGTREIIKNYSDNYQFIKLLDNPKKIAPSAINIGIKNATGDIIIRMDAHNIYKKDYISKCVAYLQKYNADNVGGIWITLPGSDTLISHAIALVLSHPFGVGNAYFRIGSKEPKEVDTVPFGCYRREVFSKIGLFDEELIRNQDDEFNYRLIKNGGKILLVPEIVSYYYARESLTKLWRTYFQYGYWKVRVMQKHKFPASWRHIVPISFVLCIFGSAILGFFYKFWFYLFCTIVILYMFISFLFSTKISLKKGIKYLFVLPISFANLHFSYGLGFLKGICDFIILKKHKKLRIDDMEITR
jgi:glycosyltransferase involved in cell wall biosynthesis